MPIQYDWRVKLTIEVEQETNGRWMAEVTDLPGAMLYGDSRESAIHAVQALALRVVADRLEHGEAVDERLLDAVFAAA